MELRGHGAGVKSAAFNLDGRRIVTVSEDHTARIWDVSPDVRTPRQLARLLRCHVPVRFQDKGSNLLIFAVPTPAECQSNASPVLSPSSKLDD